MNNDTHTVIDFTYKYFFKQQKQLFYKLLLFLLVSLMAIVLFISSLFAQHRSRLGLMLLQWVQ